MSVIEKQNELGSLKLSLQLKMLFKGSRGYLCDVCSNKLSEKDRPVEAINDLIALVVEVQCDIMLAIVCIASQRRAVTLVTVTYYFCN